MKKTNLITSALLISGLVTINCYAAGAPHRNFNKTITRDTPAGSMTRTIEQRRTENGFTRQHRLTTPNGRTAERDITVIRDPENNSRTRQVLGTRLNGGSYFGERTTTRTDNGYTRTSTRTNAEGETSIRQADVVANRGAGTITKQLSFTNYDGETSRRTVVIERPGSGASEE